MANPPFTKLDSEQVLKNAYDEVNRRIRVDSTLSLDGGDLTITLDHTDDSIRIGNGVTEDYLKINPDGSINVVPATHTSQIFDQGSNTVNSSAWVTVYTYTSVNDDTKIVNLECNSSTTSDFRVKIDGAVKRYRRSSPLQRTVDFEFKEPRTLASGEVLTVDCLVEDLGNGNVETFVALEGFINN